MSELVKILIIILSFSFLPFSSISQTIRVSYGNHYNHTRQTVRMVHSMDWFGNSDDVYIFTYEHFLKNKSISLFANYYQFEASTWMRFNEGEVIAPDGFPTLANGFSGVKVYRYDIGINYNLISNAKKFYFKPFFALGLQISKATGAEFGNLEYMNGPVYFQLEPIISESLNTSYIVPTLGVRTGFVFWKRLDVGLSVHGTYGFKAYQRLFFKYSYRGVPQETAIFEDTGTGLVVALGIGFRFVKP